MQPQQPQPIYPYRKRAAMYVALLIALLTVIFGAGSASGSFSQSSPMNVKLSMLAGFCIFLFAIFVVPFAVFAVKYWQLKRSDAPLPPAHSTPHSLPVRFSKQLLTMRFSSSGGVLTWDDGQKTIGLTTSGETPERTIFQAPFGAVRRFDDTLGQLTIWVNGERYFCVPRRPLLL